MLKLNPWLRSCTVLKPKISIALPFAALSCRSWFKGLSWISAAKSQGATESSAPVSIKIFHSCNEDLLKARGCCSKLSLHSCCSSIPKLLFPKLLLLHAGPKLLLLSPIVCFLSSCFLWSCLLRSCLSWPSCSLAWSSCFCSSFVCLQAVVLQALLGSSCFAPFVFTCSWFTRPFPNSKLFRRSWLKLSTSNTSCPSASKLVSMCEVAWSSSSVVIHSSKAIKERCQEETDLEPKLFAAGSPPKSRGLGDTQLRTCLFSPPKLLFLKLPRLFGGVCKLDLLSGPPQEGGQTGCYILEPDSLRDQHLGRCRAPSCQQVSLWHLRLLPIWSS